MSGLRFCLVMYEKYISCAKSAPSSNCSYLSRMVPNLNIVKRVCNGVFHCTPSFCILIISTLFRAFLLSFRPLSVLSC